MSIQFYSAPCYATKCEAPMCCYINVCDFSMIHANNFWLNIKYVYFEEILPDLKR